MDGFAQRKSAVVLASREKTAPPSFAIESRRILPRSSVSRLRPFSRVRPSLVTFFMVAWMWTMPAITVAQEVGSTDLVAAFLLNFLRFTTWPNESFARGSDPVVVTVIGADAVALDLAMLCIDERMGTERRSIVVHNRNGVAPGARGLGRPNRPATGEDLRNSHMVFVGFAAARHSPWILGQVEGLPILTVSDDPGFVEKGGMLALVIRGGRMTFDADPDRIDQAGLSVSSKVLRLARLAHPGGR